MTRPLNKIAAAILTDWKLISVDPARVPSYITFGLPYVRAMLELRSVDDMYGLDDGKDIVLRFLVNVASWRGASARAFKAELNAHLKEKA